MLTVVSGGETIPPRPARPIPVSIQTHGLGQHSDRAAFLLRLDAEVEQAKRMMTNDEHAEFELLQLANPEGVFAVGVGLIFPQRKQLALDRLHRRLWIALMDIDVISTEPDARLMRIFMASDAAMEWFRLQDAPALPQL